MANEGERGPLSERVNLRRMLVFAVGAPVYFAVFLFLPAGTWAWPRGWLFIVVIFAVGTLATLYLWRVNPEIMTARINAHRGTKHWDRIWLGVFFSVIMAIMPLAALDDERFHWSFVPWWVCTLGYALMIAGMAGMTWAQSVNKFFEPTVRIQTDRGHRVIDTGPYAFVRHPGYLSAFSLCVGMSLSLGSLWALIPAGLTCLLLILRTQWEDQTLQAELAGYQEYARRVRWRLIPGVW